MYPGAANPFPDAGTWRRTSEGLSAAARQPAVLSWCVPSISRPAGDNAPSRHKDGSFPSASPHIYDKLLINTIMTSNMLCKVRVKVGL